MVLPGVPDLTPSSGQKSGRAAFDQRRAGAKPGCNTQALAPLPEVFFGFGAAGVAVKHVYDSKFFELRGGEGADRDI